MLEIALILFVINQAAWFASYFRLVLATRRAGQRIAGERRELAMALELQRGKLELAEAECAQLIARLDEHRRPKLPRLSNNERLITTGAPYLFRLPVDRKGEADGTLTISAGSFEHSGKVSEWIERSESIPIPKTAGRCDECGAEFTSASIGEICGAGEVWHCEGRICDINEEADGLDHYGI